MVCKKCGIDKTESEFPVKRSKGKSYRSSACTKCCSWQGSENRRKLRAKDPEAYRKKHTEDARRWRLANPEKSKEMQKRYRDNRRKKLMELLGGIKCARCGFDDYRALHIDHVNGGGNREKLMLGQASFPLRFIREEIERYGRDKYQVLCANCNWIKRHEEGQYLQYAYTMVLNDKGKI